MKSNSFLLLSASFVFAALTISCSVASTTAALGVSTGSTSGSTSGKKETVVVNQQQPQQQQPVIIYQQQPASQPAAPQAVQVQQQQQPAPVVQQKAKNSSIRNFAVKSYDKIVKDNQKGKGDHLNSLILLLESEGIPKDESTLLIKKAIRKANGNAEVFADEIENSL
ncbi:MAG: hypothetical protein LBC87_01595 [Fibromonadaceae bacterium]|jgi:hypothetical protein|nr:hypothetical protein [Fibromonadaceae bacterium]